MMMDGRMLVVLGVVALGAAAAILVRWAVTWRVVRAGTAVAALVILVCVVIWATGRV